MILYRFDAFFELHSRATEGEKVEKRAKKHHFLANRKSLNEFMDKIRTFLVLLFEVFHRNE